MPSASSSLPDPTLLFSSHLLSGNSTTTPTATHTAPTGRNEKNESPSIPASISVSSITRFGGVPISVSIPPIELAKASGINSLVASRLASAAIDTTIGNISATVPVLLTNAPIIAVTTMTRTSSPDSDLPARLISFEPTILANPV